MHRDRVIEGLFIVIIFLGVFSINLYLLINTPLWADNARDASIITHIAATSVLGTCIITAYVLTRFKTLINPMSFARICLASLVICLIAFYVPVSFAWLPLFYIGLLALYTGILILLRELTREDISTIKNAIPIKRFSVGDNIMP